MIARRIKPGHLVLVCFPQEAKILQSIVKQVADYHEHGYRQNPGRRAYWEAKHHAGKDPLDTEIIQATRQDVRQSRAAILRNIEARIAAQKLRNGDIHIAIEDHESNDEFCALISGFNEARIAAATSCNVSEEILELPPLHPHIRTLTPKERDVVNYVHSLGIVIDLLLHTVELAN
jgi:hypothetical protein